MSGTILVTLCNLFHLIFIPLKVKYYFSILQMKKLELYKKLKNQFQIMQQINI